MVYSIVFSCDNWFNSFSEDAVQKIHGKNCITTHVFHPYRSAPFVPNGFLAFFIPTELIKQLSQFFEVSFCCSVIQVWIWFVFFDVGCTVCVIRMPKCFAKFPNSFLVFITSFYTNRTIFLTVFFGIYASKNIAKSVNCILFHDDFSPTFHHFLLFII